ncbi:hypothetical protein SAY86_007335 [Trapa natans]|uniref:UV-stimulated scaffold protein A C-terminal domain-containing protein n=1 Tax=Trapa natans TaxID=22666 RepID=A0AAN7LLN8_TRANT|nr:hypothetical protein SAY86_007335 [Trapa natans]
MCMEEDGGKVRALIEKATNSTAGEVDPRLLKCIKSLVRYSNTELQIAAHTLMTLMKRNHSQVRFLSLHIVDELFMRSKLFRNLIIKNLDQLLTLSVGFRRNAPLPAPLGIASRLRAKAIEFLEKWNASFGIHYRQLRLGFDYLKNTLKFQFPDSQGNAARIQQERMEREIRTREIMQKKFSALKDNFTSIKEEVLSAIHEIEQCLDIVHTRDELVPLTHIDDEDELHSHELLQIRLASLKEGGRVHENKDNKVVFDTIRELYKLLVTKHLPLIQESINIVVRVDAIDSKVRDSTLKELINLQNKIHAGKRRCENSVSDVLVSRSHSEEEEDFWEEEKVGEVEESTRKTPEEHSDDISLLSICMLNDNSLRCSEKDFSINRNPGCAFVANGSDSMKRKLLAEAPVVKWGSYLDNWGSKDVVLANQRGLELENHWGRVDYDAVIPADKISELNVQATLYKEKQVIAVPCGAPLRSGSFCQRRDLKVCPFHGPIIPRDSEGRPVNQVSSADKRVQYPPNDFVKKLAEESVKNVRTRDREEEEKRMVGKQALKRAKLAKIREHNEVVLRDATFASTSSSATNGGLRYFNGGGESSECSKKHTLSSMLRKKVTRKDKLSRRLLNTRATDAATRQLAEQEDQCYREAFPNQW